MRTLRRRRAGTVTGRPGWWLDELASAGRENLDPSHVAHYDDKEDAGASAEVELLLGLGVGADATVVDIGAGTGQFAVAMAPHCRRVVAVDVSPPMLERLRAKAGGNVEVVRGGFLTYAHEGAPADLVYSRWALHHLPDFWKVIALRRMRDVLRPGGLLRLVDLVFSFDVDTVEAGVERWCGTVPVSGSGDEWVRADIEEHVRDEHSTFTWLLEPMLERAGFRIERADHGADGVSAAYVARASEREPVSRA